MPPAKKRKTTNSGDSVPTWADKPDDEKADTDMPEAAKSEPTMTKKPSNEASNDQQPVAAVSAPAPAPKTAAKPSSTTSSSSSSPTPAAPAEDAAAKAQERMAKFRALQARAKSSADQNLKEATREAQRIAADPAQLTALDRRHAIASHKLLKADAEDRGEDFERKRAWDWTVEESEKWDRRMRKKEAHRDDTAFRDYAHESEKAYKRQLRNMGDPDLERYTREKMAAIEKAAAAGTLDIVETEDGELIAVDKDGTFFSTANSTTFAQHRPDKAAVDRLVADTRKAEEAQLKKRKERMANNGDDADVTYINEKNKQFNQKLSRFYNKYTADIRDSFERGTMV
ncbi:SYF2 splicing factor-domain-containing protein [Diplogelasinospora grovesii]|uniref:Pre-mRNA-splicing factor SYF2 n=1 Tax=Diplogelasinospora grovesii TaxID=303347 RepID=A0AAN6NEZ3_9PEZI|nr:SYF2 splicing factor-domain-containing protein [Diplogelasinospora grovesii]